MGDRKNTDHLVASSVTPLRRICYCSDFLSVRCVVGLRRTIYNFNLGIAKRNISQKSDKMIDGKSYGTKA